MKIIIDTNVLVSSLSRRSESNWIIQAFLNKDFTLVVSHEIHLEYEEILRIKYNSVAVDNFLRSIHESENVEMVDVYFQWKLLQDPDDNKFADAAIASGADYLVSEDRGFKVLQNIDFPKIAILRLNDFEKILNQT
jgi:putative PIN family toxin of toxin-antitoxin system